MRFTDRHHLETVSRAGACGHYVGDNRVLCRLLGKYKMYVEGYDMAMTPHLILDGFWEPWITVFISKLIQPGWMCVDGGAHVGYNTVLMADLVGHKGKVHAFEPGAIFELLKWNVEINGFAKIVELHSEALHLKDAEPQYLFHDPNDLGGARLKPTTEAEPDAVETISMDELFLDKPPDFVKLDIEGGEEAAMDGASELIAKHLNTRWLVEFYRARFPMPQRFLNKVLAAGFELRYIDYDSTIKSITMDQLLNDPRGHWMLWLCR